MPRGYCSILILHTVTRKGPSCPDKGHPVQLGHFRIIRNFSWLTPSSFKLINTAFTFPTLYINVLLLEHILQNSSDQTFSSCCCRRAVCFLDDDCCLCSLTWTYSYSANRDLIKADRPNMGRKTSLLITANSHSGTLPARLLSHLLYQQFFSLSWSHSFLFLTSPLLPCLKPSEQAVYWVVQVFTFQSRKHICWRVVKPHWSWASLELASHPSKGICNASEWPEVVFQASLQCLSAESLSAIEPKRCRHYHQN